MSDGTYADQLKPCPWCRGKNLLFTAGRDGLAYIECWDCFARGPLAKGWAWTKRKWNQVRRSGDQA